MSGFGRGRAAAGRHGGTRRTIRRRPLVPAAAAVAPVKPERGQSPRQDVPAAEKTNADAGRSQTGARTTKPRSRTDRSSIDRPIGRPIRGHLRLAAVRSTAFRDTGDDKASQTLHPGRPIARLKHRDRSFDERHVGPGVRKRDARPPAGSNLRRAHLENPTSAVGRKGVESDTVTRVTTGRPRRRPSSRDGNPSKLRDASRGPDQAT